MGGCDKHLRGEAMQASGACLHCGCDDVVCQRECDEQPGGWFYVDRTKECREERERERERAHSSDDGAIVGFVLGLLFLVLMCCLRKEAANAREADQDDYHEVPEDGVVTVA